MVVSVACSADLAEVLNILTLVIYNRFKSEEAASHSRARICSIYRRLTTMLYRPNFCSNCGEKIDRANWPLLASRRFCDLCQTEHQAVDWLPRLVVAIGLIFGSAGLIAFYRPAQRAENVDLKQATEVVKRPVTTSGANQINATPPSIPQSQTGPTLAQTDRTLISPPVTQRSATKGSESDAVFYCGAETKKGTPCTRRVKRPGERCWQHQGMPAKAENAQKIMR